MLHSGVLALIVLALSLASRPLRAEAALVVLVRPAAESEIVSEAITRIRGELVADGFAVSVVDAPRGPDPAWVLARGERQTSATVTAGLFLHADAKAAEVWVVERSTRKTTIRTIDLSGSPGGSDPEVLARRSVELLRASLLEVLVGRGKSARPGARDEATHSAELGPGPERSPWGVEAGAQVLGGFGDVGSAVLPVGRVRFGFARWLAARLTLSGLGTRPRVESAQGSATVSQELGLLEAVGEIAPPGWLVPSVSLGAGVYHIGIDGSAHWPYEGLAEDRFSFAMDAGAGVALSIAPSFALSLELHATAVAPYPVVRFLGVNTAEVKNPLLSGVVTLVGWP